MTISIKEKEFENHIEETLLKSGYKKRFSSNFDKELALDRELVLEFIKNSQSNSWKKIQEMYGSDSGYHN